MESGYEMEYRYSLLQYHNIDFPNPRHEFRLVCAFSGPNIDIKLLRKCLRQEREEEAQEKECNGLGATWRWKTGSTIHDSTIYCTYI